MKVTQIVHGKTRVWCLYFKLVSALVFIFKLCSLFRDFTDFWLWSPCLVCIQLVWCNGFIILLDRTKTVTGPFTMQHLETNPPSLNCYNLEGWISMPGTNGVKLPFISELTKDILELWKCFWNWNVIQAYR